MPYIHAEDTRRRMNNICFQHECLKGIGQLLSNAQQPFMEFDDDDDDDKRAAVY